MNNIEKRRLYDSIMETVSLQIKKALQEQNYDNEDEDIDEEDELFEKKKRKSSKRKSKRKSRRNSLGGYYPVIPIRMPRIMHIHHCPPPPPPHMHCQGGPGNNGCPEGPGMPPPPPPGPIQ